MRTDEPAVHRARAERLSNATGALATAAIAAIDARLPWFGRLPAQERSWIGLVAQSGITAFVEWFRDPDPDAPVPTRMFGSAPREFTRVISLHQTVDLVRTTIEMIETTIGDLLPADDVPAVREAMQRYAREVAFAAATVYAQAAELRGAWDARLEALVVDAVIRGETDESVRSRASALGWTATSTAGGPAQVTVVVGRARLPDPLPAPDPAPPSQAPVAPPTPGTPTPGTATPGAAAPGADAPGRAPLGADAPGQAPLDADASVQAPLGADASSQGPPGAGASGQAPLGAGVPDPAPLGTDVAGTAAAGTAIPGAAASEMTPGTATEPAAGTPPGATPGTAAGAAAETTPGTTLSTAARATTGTPSGATPSAAAGPAAETSPAARPSTTAGASAETSPAARPSTTTGAVAGTAPGAMPGADSASGRSAEPESAASGSTSMSALETVGRRSGAAYVAEAIRQAAREAGVDALCAIQGDRLVVVLGGTDRPVEVVQKLDRWFGPGPIVVGPVVPDLTAAVTSARAAVAGLRAVAAWPGAPRPVQADELLPERSLSGDGHARRQLATEVYGPLTGGDGVLLTTVAAYLDSGGSVEATARALFVHPNTVRYRLKRVADLTGYAAGHPRDAFTLRVALALGRLLNPEPGSQIL